MTRAAARNLPRLKLMTKAELEQIGLTPEMVLDRLTEKMLERYGDPDGMEHDFENRIEAAVKNQSDEQIAAIFDRSIIPTIKERIDGIVLQATNAWGEPKQPPLTLTEYMVQRIDAYIREPVNYQGKAKRETDGYSWSEKGTRITHLIHEHLQFHIEKAVEKALGEVNSSVRKGLQEAVNIALKSVSVKIDTKVQS